MTTMKERQQSATPGVRVIMFDLDLYRVTGQNIVFRFTPMIGDDIGGIVRWQGNEYKPMPIEIQGVEVAVRGSLPRPKVRISNVVGEGSTLIKQYGNLAGAELTRWQTFSDYLDDGPTPDPNAYLPTDVFVFDRITGRNNLQVEWECRSIIDYNGKRLPARQILRDACDQIYRTPNAGGGFNYARATCPFTGNTYLDEMGQFTTWDKDRCGKTLNDCRARFGNTALPFRGFPGVGRFR